MLTVIALLLAFFFLPTPWNVVVVVGTAAVDVVETAWFLRWSKRRRSAVGTQALVGAVADVLTPLQPRGQVRVGGEIWSAYCETGSDRGERVRITAVKGLVLEVEPE